jgi:hypothetical protein
MADGERDACWYCGGFLCVYCRDRFGVCGCPGSDRAHDDLIHATTAAERRSIMTRRVLAGAAKKRTR